MKTLNLVRLLMCVVIVISFFSNPTSVYACSCEAGVTLSTDYERHDAVFTGKVFRIVDNYYPVFSTLDNVFQKLGFIPYFFYEGGRNFGYSIFFKVLDSWKGVEQDAVEVDTGYGSGDCGYNFQTGNEYLIYASNAYGIEGNYWVTGICGRTALLSDANEDLEYLGSFPKLKLKPTLPIYFTEKDIIIFSLLVMVIFIVLTSIRKYLKIKKV